MSATSPSHIASGVLASPSLLGCRSQVLPESQECNKSTDREIHATAFTQLALRQLARIAPVASALTRIRSVTWREFYGNSLKWIVLRRRQTCTCLPHPLPCTHSLCFRQDIRSCIKSGIAAFYYQVSKSL